MKPVKFAVWGVGIRGKNVVDILDNKIVCIIESNSGLRNTHFKGIPIISYEEYLEKYTMYPIIVTPLGYEREIKETLFQKGVQYVFSYSENCHFLEGFRKDGAVANCLRKYDQSREILIYGAKLLGVLLYNYLVEQGYECRLATQPDGKICFSDRTETVQWENEQGKDTYVILTEPLDENKRSELDSLKIEYESYYESFIPMLRNFYYNPKLEYFKGIHKGQRCFIVATGPSLRIEDLDKLYQKKEICFGVNGIFSAFDKTIWRPKYYMCGDRNAVFQWKKEITEGLVETTFIAEDVAPILDEIGGQIWRWRIFRNWVEGEIPQFSDDFSRGTFTGWTITYDGPLQLAVYMGFKEIYLLGVDCNYIKGSKKNYFEEQKREDNLDHHEERMLLAYRSAEQYTRTHGIKIFNATRGGMLDVFERVDFDLLMKG